jgi:hypothetical protein
LHWGSEKLLDGRESTSEASLDADLEKYFLEERKTTVIAYIGTMRTRRGRSRRLTGHQRGEDSLKDRAESTGHEQCQTKDG